MDDTISRQAAIDALADYIHNVDRVIGTGHLSADDCKDAATSVLADLPSAQPEIIRCKDCKYARLTYDGSCKYCDVWFPDEAEYMDGDYYCASAERKSNG